MIMFSCSDYRRHIQFSDGEHHTVILVPLVSLLPLACMFIGKFFRSSRDHVTQGKGRVVFKKLAIVRLNIPFTGPDPSFAFAVATLGRHASSAGALQLVII